MRIVKSPADGDCFYHSVINGTGLKTTPQELKVKVAEYLSRYPDMHDDLLIEWLDFKVIPKRVSIEDTIKLLQKEWATSTIIHIVSLILELDIVVFEKINNKYYKEEFPSRFKNNKNFKSRGKIYILKTRNHFDLLLLSPPSIQSPPLQTHPQPQNEVYKDSILSMISPMLLLLFVYSITLVQF